MGKIINYLNGLGPNFGYFVLAVSGVILLSIIIYFLYKWESRYAGRKYVKMYKDYTL
jgi:hypothetical protein